MVLFDSQKCIGCTACVKDCFPGNILIENGKAKPIHSSCMSCGHCVAVCPAHAVELIDLDMEDVTDVTAPKFTAAELLSFIKARRSIRQYQDRPVASAITQQIIEAGRYTATASNRQALSFIVIEKEMQAFRAIVMKNLAERGRAMLASDAISPAMKGYGQRWIAIEEAYRKDPQAKDAVFFGAPVVILIAGDNAIDAGLAASNMELVACANGLGMLYSGFITRGTTGEDAKRLLGIPDGKEIQTALVIGHPAVHYKRSAPRKPADIIWR